MTTRVVIEARTVGRSEVTAPRIALGCGNFGGIGSAPEFFGRGARRGAGVRDHGRGLGAGDHATSTPPTPTAAGAARRRSAAGCASRGARPAADDEDLQPDGVRRRPRPRARARSTRQLHSSLERLGVEQRRPLPDARLRPRRRAGRSSSRRSSGCAPQGLIRATGVSNYDAAQLRATLADGPRRRDPELLLAARARRRGRAARRCARASRSPTPPTARSPAAG